VVWYKDIKVDISGKVAEGVGGLNGYALTPISGSFRIRRKDELFTKNYLGREDIMSRPRSS
jgi:hypothetical protein